jgi:hypothetical protein
VTIADRHDIENAKVERSSSDRFAEFLHMYEPEPGWSRDSGNLRAWQRDPCTTSHVQLICKIIVWMYKGCL